MTYKAITTAAYVPIPDAGPFTDYYYALAFPAAWRQAILDLYRHGKRSPELVRQVPIRRLNDALRAVAPDLVSVAKNAAVDDGRPWLYTRREYPLAVLNSLIASWLYTLQPSAEAFPLVADAMRQLDVSSLNWELMGVNLSEQTVSAGGTAVPAPHLYHLLPDVLAERIERLAPYEYCGTQVRFKSVATEQGAELVSWPPSEYRPKPKKGQVSRPWRFSGVIRLSLQTVPFSPVPQIHVATGIRRWVRDPFRLPDQSLSVYLGSDAPWLVGAEESARFAVARLRYGKKEHAPVWAVGGPEGILARLSTATEFPAAKSLTEEPGSWIDGRSGVTAAVTYHTANGFHGVGAGLGPSERQRLSEWAAQAFAPEFRPLGKLTRSGRRPTAPHPVLEERESVPKKDPTPEKVAAAEAANAVIDAANAVRRRERLACVVGDDRVFSCDLLYQTDAVRDALVNAAERSLGLASHRVAGATRGTWVWRTPEVEVRLRAVPLGELGGPLGGETTPKRGAEHKEAVAHRRVEVRDYLMSLEKTSQLALVELDGKDAFPRPRTDPKGAIRIGCADAGRVSQFITPDKQQPDEAADAENGPDDEPEGTLEHRAAAAWADGLRQAGMSFVPQHSLDVAIPGDLNQLAFWIVRRNASESSWHQQFTPVAVLIRPDQDTIVGRMPGTQGWVPYPQLLRDLTGQVRGADLKTAEQQSAETARFVRQVLYMLRNEPTVVLTHAQNTRNRWDWLKNGQLAADKIRVGGGPVQDLALHGKQLTLIRVRDGDRDETAQWWAPDKDEIAGWSQGLWVPPGAVEGNRVFYATTEKPGSHQKKKRDDTKLTPHVVNKESGKQVTNWTRNAWNPTLLEITIVGHAPGADPEAWAMYVQQQRFADDYRYALKFPLALHLAELTAEYALPYGEEPQETAILDGASDDSHAEGDLGLSLRRCVSVDVIPASKDLVPLNFPSLGPG